MRIALFALVSVFLYGTSIDSVRLQVGVGNFVTKADKPISFCRFYVEEISFLCMNGVLYFKEKLPDSKVSFTPMLKDDEKIVKCECVK